MGMKIRMTMGMRMTMEMRTVLKMTMKIIKKNSFLRYQRSEARLGVSRKTHPLFARVRANTPQKNQNAKTKNPKTKKT